MVAKQVAAGLCVGMILSIVPLEGVVLVVPGLLFGWLWSLRRRPAVCERIRYWPGIGAAGLVVVTAVVLPVKHLDKVVAPVRFEWQSLDSLCHALYGSRRIMVSAPYPEGTNVLLAFEIDHPMTKREVLEKLAADSGCELHLGYCGSGATLLFGSHPSFTSLRMKNRASQAGGRTN
jgi:hypothetical protein